jgi:hypothetical protein
MNNAGKACKGACVSSLSASLVVLGLFLLLALPVLAAWLRPPLMRIAAPFSILVAMGAAATHVGFGVSTPPAAPDTGGAGTVAPATCEEAIGALDQAGFFIDRRDAARPVVDQAVWAQLPEAARDVVRACLAAEAGAESVEIVEQARR